MKKIYLFSLSVILTLIFIRCNNDNEIVNDEKIICREYSEFYFYKGSNYIFDFIEYTDGSIDFLGDTTSTDFLTISNALQNKNLSVLTFTDDTEKTMYLFDSQEEKEEYMVTIRKPVKNTFKSASTSRSLYVTCYDDADYTTTLFDLADPDNGLTPTTYNTENWQGFSNLALMNGHNYDNKIESIYILNYTGMAFEIQLYTDPSYTGFNWSIYSRPSSENTHGNSEKDSEYNLSHLTLTSHLKDFGTRFAYSSGKLWWYQKHYWDNKVSSIRWKLDECTSTNHCNDF